MVVRLRPPTPSDLDDVLEVIVACDVADVGEPDFTREDLEHEWTRPGFSLADDSRLAELDGEIVGMAAFRDRGVWVCVHPERQGRGAGTALREWAEARAPELGHIVHRQFVAEGNAAARAMLEGAGYRRVRSYWWLRMSLDKAAPPEPAWPDGIAVRTVDPVADAAGLHAVSEAAFASVPDYQPERLDEFAREHLGAPATARDLSPVAERDGRIAGFALSERRRAGFGHVALLAVAPDEAGRGVGRALLAEALRRFAAEGLSGAEIDVAGDNPRALRLYESVGFQSLHRTDAYERGV